jgi:hypothetical protein
MSKNIIWNKSTLYHYYNGICSFVLVSFYWLCVGFLHMDLENRIEVVDGSFDDIWCLTPLSAISQLYHDDQF